MLHGKTKHHLTSYCNQQLSARATDVAELERDKLEKDNPLIGTER